MAKTTITMSEEDFLASQRTFYKSRLAPKIMIVVGLGLMIYTTVGMAQALSSANPNHALDTLPMAVVCAAWLWLGGNYVWGAPLGARRYFRQSQMRHPLEYEWNDAAISVRGENTFHRHPWGELLRWKEDRSSIMIVTTDRSFIPVPKRLFNDGDLAELRTFLQQVRRVWRRRLRPSQDAK